MLLFPSMTFFIEMSKPFRSRSQLLLSRNVPASWPEITVESTFMSSSMPIPSRAGELSTAVPEASPPSVSLPSRWGLAAEMSKSLSLRTRESFRRGEYPPSIFMECSPLRISNPSTFILPPANFTEAGDSFQETESRHSSEGLISVAISSESPAFREKPQLSRISPRLSRADLLSKEK